jgi:hypothetical protein
MLPYHYGNTELTGKQQLIGQGIQTAGNVLQSFFTSRGGTGIQPSSGAGYYDPALQPPPKPNYVPLIIGTTVVGVGIVALIVVLRRKK